MGVEAMRKPAFQLGNEVQEWRSRWRLASKICRAVGSLRRPLRGWVAAHDEVASKAPMIQIPPARISITIALVKVDWKKVTAPRNSAKALIVKDGRILVIRKKVGTELWYLLPGGGQEKGETLHEALKREC